MKAAREPRADKTKVKLLVVKDGAIEESSIERPPDHLQPGDSLVVNDAATPPASSQARDARNNQVELRLTTQLGDRVWRAVVFGAGDWRAPTEERPAPPRFAEGEEILIAPDFRARVRGEDRLSERSLNLELPTAQACHRPAIRKSTANCRSPRGTRFPREQWKRSGGP